MSIHPSFGRSLLLSCLVFMGAGCFPSSPTLPSTSTEITEANSTVENWPSSTQPNIPSANITVDAPLSYAQIVGNAIAVSGTARVFENQLNWELRTGDTVIQNGTAMADAPDIGQFGPYSFSVDVTTIPADTMLTLEVFDYSAKDGAKENEVIVPLLR